MSYIRFSPGSLSAAAPANSRKFSAAAAAEQLPEFLPAAAESLPGKLPNPLSGWCCKEAQLVLIFLKITMMRNLFPEITRQFPKDSSN